MKIGISTSVIQRGKTGIAHYLFSLLAELKHFGEEHTFALFVLEEDAPLREKPDAHARAKGESPSAQPI